MAGFIKEFDECGFAVGCMTYLDHYPGEENSPKIVLSIQIKNSAPIMAIMDTGAPWCIFDPDLLSLSEVDKEDGYRPDKGLNIRGTIYYGVLSRLPITFLADEGRDISVEATVFIPDRRFDNTWQFPNFIGLDGCLSRLRFAIDPSENIFYFGQ